MKQPFFKYHGRGNDFLLIDDRKENFPIQNKEKIQKLCHRHIGIGADGIILLQSSKKADFRMRILNADGSEAKSCGNGLCCLLQFVSDLGFPDGKYRIETLHAQIEAFVEDQKVTLLFPAPQVFALDQELFLEEGTKQRYSYVDSGVPHVVCFFDEIQTLDLFSLGRKIRFHSRFQPEGANVNFVKREKEKEFSVRVFERGVEGETLSCGTGAIAIAAVAFNLYSLKESVRISYAHGALEVFFEKEKDKISSVRMVGSAERVFSGRLS